MTGSAPWVVPGIPVAEPQARVRPGCERRADERCTVHSGRRGGAPLERGFPRGARVGDSGLGARAGGGRVSAEAWTGRSFRPAEPAGTRVQSRWAERAAPPPAGCALGLGCRTDAVPLAFRGQPAGGRPLRSGRACLCSAPALPCYQRERSPPSARPWVGESSGLQGPVRRHASPHVERLSDTGVPCGMELCSGCRTLQNS